MATSAPAAGKAASASPDGRTQIFDIGIQTAPPAELLRRILGLVEEGGRHRVSYVNAHVLNQSLASPELRNALQSSDLVYCDGYGVRLAARLIGLPVPHRMTGADWIWGSPPCARSGGARSTCWAPIPVPPRTPPLPCGAGTRACEC